MIKLKDIGSFKSIPEILNDIITDVNETRTLATE